MKVIAAICLMFALLGLALGLKDPVCGLPAAAEGNGHIVCTAYMPRYSYHPESNSCERFIYGGCGGNDNRFFTQEECEQKCKE
ncbi:hypothetical protein KR018_009839 [Drosophila ironensis]|nr:hypothetical protein KR018_009839 [Drosophila ironensis]